MNSKRGSLEDISSGDLGESNVDPKESLCCPQHPNLFTLPEVKDRESFNGIPKIANWDSLESIFSSDEESPVNFSLEIGGTLLPAESMGKGSEFGERQELELNKNGKTDNLPGLVNETNKAEIAVTELNRNLGADDEESGSDGACIIEMMEIDPESNEDETNERTTPQTVPFADQTEMEGSQAEPSDDPTGEGFPVSLHLKTHIQVMHRTCLFPFNEEGERTSNAHTVIFVTLAIIIVLSGLAWQKSYFLMYVEVGNLDHYREAWYRLSGITIGLAFLILALWNWKEIKKVVKESCRDKQQNDNNDSNVSRTVLALGLISLIVPALLVIQANLIIKGFGIKDILLLKSEYFSNDLLIWSSSNLNESMIRHEHEYGTEAEFTKITVLFAIIGLTSQYIRRVLESLAQDVLLVASLYLDETANHFRSELNELTAAANNLTWKMLETLYPKFEYMHHISTLLDEGFGHFFKIMHLSNLLWLSYTTLEILNGEIELFFVLVNGIRLAKILAMYYHALRSAKIGKEYRAALLKTKRRTFEVQDMELTLLLKKIKEFPVGIGSGRFRINQAFVNTCFTLCLSWVVVLWNVPKDDE